MRKKRLTTPESGIGSDDVFDSHIADGRFSTPYQSSSSILPTSPKGFRKLPLELYYETLSHLPLPALLTLRMVSRDHARLVGQYIESSFRRGDYVLEVMVYESPQEQEERRELRKQRRRFGQVPGNVSNNQVVDPAASPQNDRRANPPVEYWCQDFTLASGARLEFFPKIKPPSSGSSSGISDDGNLNIHQPGSSSALPSQNPPVTGTDSYSSASSSSRDLERQFTRIKLRFKDPANTTRRTPSSASSSGGLWTEAELDALPHTSSPNRNVQRTSPSVRVPPSFSVTFPFHPRTQLGTHVWNHHRHSSVAITYTVEDQGAGSYALLIRSVSVQWAWLSRKVAGTRATVPGFLPERRPSVTTSPSPTSFPQSRSPVYDDDLIREETEPGDELSPPRPPRGPFPRSSLPTTSDPLRNPTSHPGTLPGPALTTSTSPTSLGVPTLSSSSSHSSADDSSSLLYSTDTGSELWDASDKEDGLI